MLQKLKLVAKKALAPVLYRHRPGGMSGKLYLDLDAVYRTRALAGAVVEVGCNVGGTASLGAQMLRKPGSARRYLCVDTFGGFVEGQDRADVERGNRTAKSAAFAANDRELTRRVLDLHGAGEVHPRLEPGGVILVDDRGEVGSTGWQAGDAVRDFARAEGLEVELERGLARSEAPR